MDFDLTKVLVKEELDQEVKQLYYRVVLKRAKEGRKLGINELANAVGCSPAAISKWYRNQFIPGVELLVRIAVWLDKELGENSNVKL